MAEAAQASPSVAHRQPSQSYPVFLLQVSRPGLWSTTALFYLMPLGHADILHSGKLWLGLFFVLFPLGFLLYGVNDIVDAENDSLNPRKGTFMFGSRGARAQLAALKWQIAVVQLPLQTFLFGAMFAMHSHIFGEVMDIEPDRLSGRRTMATLIGRVRAKLLIAVLLVIETALVHIFFRDWIIAGFLAFGALWFLVDATLVWKNRAYSPREMRLFLWG